LSPPREQLYRALGYRFSDHGLCERALTHRSLGRDNNERLEFLGDAILGFVIADSLFQRFPEASEGLLSRLRSSLVKREALAELARDLGLSDHLLLGPGELRSGGHSRDSILADALEALFGAIHLDAGYQGARQVILTLYHERLQGLDPATQQKDPKTRLQELLQARQLALPTYEVVAITGTPHAQSFEVRCRVAELGWERTGQGSSRRRAEQAAAQQLLEVLQDG